MLIDRVDRMTPGQILADTEVADFIAQMGIGIARAQRRLDNNSIRQLIKLGRTSLEDELNEGLVAPDNAGNPAPGGRRSLLSLGLTPAFYHFQEAELEVSLNITMTVDRTTVVTLDTGFEYGDKGQKGEATLEVKQEEASRATATVTLKDNTTASKVKVTDDNEDGEAAKEVDLPTSGGPRGATLGQTADNLATSLEALTEVHEAKVTILPGTGVLNITSTDDGFAIQGNRITVLEEPAIGAVAYAELQAVKDADAPTIDWTADLSSPTPVQDTYTFHAGGTTAVVIAGNLPDSVRALAAEITNVNTAYEGRLLTQDNVFVMEPRPANHADEDDNGTPKPGLVGGDFTPLLVRFDTAEYEVDASSENEAALDEVVRFLKVVPTAKLKVWGHTDIVGNTSGYDNQTLSDKRAGEVVKELVARGIDRARITEVKGYASTRPLCVYRYTGSPADDPDYTVKNQWNRRVEFRLDRASTHPILKVWTDTTGDNRLEIGKANSSLEPLGRADGHDVISVAGDAVDIDGKTFTEGASGAGGFAMGADPTASAKALADAINAFSYATPAETLSASAAGPVVTVGGEGSTAQIVLTSARFGVKANKVRVTAEGAINATGFSGAEGARRPEEGATVTIAGKVLTLVTDPDELLEAKEFRLGDDAEETAANLATTIGTLGKIETSVDGAVITISAPLGTTLATSAPKVFDLSDKRIGGPAKVKTEEKNQAFAMHANISVTDARRFGLQVTGHSKINTRLVSLPAPVALLDEVKAFLEED